MIPYIDIFIQNGTKIDRQYLVGRVRDVELGKNSSAVYIYSLADETVNYPNKPGHVLYIGEAGRLNEPTGKRFGQHISTGESVGGDLGTIYALSRYYWLGKRIRLQVFLVKDGQRKVHERDLLLAHVKEFGTLPMCQGTTGTCYTTNRMSALVTSQDHLALFSPASGIALCNQNDIAGS